MSNYMDLVREFGASGRAAGEAAASPLPAVHDADDPWVKPTAPCTGCGRVQWRVWCHGQRKVWQWICNGCRPLVVAQSGGSRGGQAARAGDSGPAR